MNISSRMRIYYIELKFSIYAETLEFEEFVVLEIVFCDGMMLEYMFHVLVFILGFILKGIVGLLHF